MLEIFLIKLALLYGQNKLKINYKNIKKDLIKFLWIIGQIILKENNVNKELMLY